MATQEDRIELRPLKKKIFLAYPYYWPHYKAGGPVQSLYNLCSFFKNDFTFYLISSVKDIDGSDSTESILPDQWNSGPNGEHVFYTSVISWAVVGRLLNEIRPHVIYVNGIFNINTTLPALYYGKRLKSKIIISPRGMLQAWGLERNKWKKRIFLRMLYLFLGRQEEWHATDTQEKEDILRYFGERQIVHVASNIPRATSALHALPLDRRGPVKLVFLSLINPNKNLHLVLEALHQFSPDQFSLAIYGPVIDKEYWSACKQKMKDLPAVSYMGPLLPWEVPLQLQQYHFFILPTQGENFGHAIFDSLSAGVPVAISKNTPWMHIDEKKAGFYFNTITREAIAGALSAMADLPEGVYSQYRSNALEYAADYWQEKQYKKEYSFLL